MEQHVKFMVNIMTIMDHHLRVYGDDQGPSRTTISGFIVTTNASENMRCIFAAKNYMSMGAVLM